MSSDRYNPKKHRDSYGTFLFTASFVILIILFSTLLTGIFITLSRIFSRDTENNQSSLFDIIDSQSMANWSSLSDFATATLGIAVALAGSVVAIYIAHRAYTITRKQAFLEERAIVERAVDTTVDTLWNMAGALRDLFDRTEELVNSAFLFEGQRGYSQNPKDEINLSLFESSYGEYSKSVEQVRLGMLKIIRDPIARSAFQDASSRFTNELSSHISKSDPIIRKAWDDALSVNGNIDALSSLMVNSRNMSSASPSLPARIVFVQINLKAYKTSDGRNYIRKERRYQRDGNHRVIEVKKNLSEIEDGLTLAGVSLRRHLTDSKTLLHLSGAYLRLELLEKGNPECWLNLGAVVLTTVINSFPIKSDLIRAHDEHLEKNLGFGKDILSHSRQHLVLSGVENFLSERIKLAAKTISGAPASVIVRRAGYEGLKSNE